MRTGIRQLYEIRELFVLAVSTGLYNLGYFAAIGILALYTRDVLHVGEIWYGGLFAVLGTAGTLVGWFGTGLIRGMTDLRVRAATLAIPGFGWLIAAAVPNIWVTVALFASVGATAVLGALTTSSAYQRLAPEGSLGRITSIGRLFAFGGSGVGSLIGGWVAAGWGLTAPLFIAGGGSGRHGGRDHSRMAATATSVPARPTEQNRVVADGSGRSVMTEARERTRERCGVGSRKKARA
jgi:hypothetical protein